MEYKHLIIMIIINSDRHIHDTDIHHQWLPLNGNAMLNNLPADDDCQHQHIDHIDNKHQNYNHQKYHHQNNHNHTHADNDNL